jgi:hypothetical protein
LMQKSLKTSAHKLTDCFTAFAMTKKVRFVIARYEAICRIDAKEFENLCP